MWKGHRDAADKDLISVCDYTRLRAAPDPLGASHYNIGTIMTARKNAAERTKGWEQQDILYL